MKYTFTLFLSLFIIGHVFSQDQVIVRLKQASKADLNYFEKAQDEVTAFREGQYLDLLISKTRLETLKSEAWDFTITQTAEQNKENLSVSKDINGYHTYDEAVAVLQQIAADYPDICTLTDIADSHGKEYYNSGISGYEDYQHDIWMLKISDNVNESEDEPAVYYMGAHHAREPISTEVVLGLIEHLTSGYGVNDEITTMIDNAEIFIVPMVNPDGHEVVLDQLNTWWRKSAADNNEDGVFNYTSDGPDGVDPNRNYGWNWSGAGSSGNPNDDTYHGPSAFSEPGVAAMRDLLAAQHFVTGISYHSYSELVLYPYGYSYDCQAPDYLALAELGVNMAESIPKIVGSGHYTPEQANDLYAASGGTDDWAYGHHGVFCYTVELGQEFIPSAAQVPTIVSDNIEAAMMLLNRPNHQVLRGHVYDAETLEPVVATIFIDGVDNNGASFREDYKSSETYGDYYRLLMPGEVEATYTAYGYLPQTISNTILNEEATIQDVYLQKAAQTILIGSVLDGDTGENIEGVEVSILNTPLSPVFTNENGVYSMEEVSYGNFTIKVYKEGYSPIMMEKTIDGENYVFNFVLLPSDAITFEDGIFGDDFSMSSHPWVIDNNVAYEGDYSSASGNIGDNTSTTMTLTTENRADGAISFFTKVSSESNYDFLKFYIDGNEQGQWSGEMNWTGVSFPLSEGDHELKWEYKKDANTTGGSDKVWVDYIEIPPILTTTANAGIDQIICQDETAQLNAFAQNYTDLSWSTSGDGSFSDEHILNPIYTPGSNDIAQGSTSLSIDVEGTQSISDELLLTIDICSSLEEINGALIFHISPNPAPQYFTINMPDFKGGSLEIWNMTGNMVFAKTLEENKQSYTHATNDLEAGVYLLKLKNTQGEFSVERLVIP